MLPLPMTRLLQRLAPRFLLSLTLRDVVERAPEGAL